MILVQWGGPRLSLIVWRITAQYVLFGRRMIREQVERSLYGAPEEEGVITRRDTPDKITTFGCTRRRKHGHAAVTTLVGAIPKAAARAGS